MMSHSIYRYPLIITLVTLSLFIIKTLYQSCPWRSLGQQDAVLISGKTLPRFVERDGRFSIDDFFLRSVEEVPSRFGRSDFIVEYGNAEGCLYLIVVDQCGAAHGAGLSRECF